MKTIQKLILGLAISIAVFSSTEGMETEQVRAEVDRVLEKFHRNMDEYYQRTRAKKRINPIAGDSRSQHSTVVPILIRLPSNTPLYSSPFVGLEKHFSPSLLASLEHDLGLSQKARPPKSLKGNWTETFRLKNGEVASHTPEQIKFGSFISGKEFNNQGKMTYNGRSLGSFRLAVDSTREEFIAGLKASGLY